MNPSPTESETALPAVVKRLGLVSFLTDASSEMIYPLLPAFLKSLGAGAATLGLMEGVAESVSAFLKWWVGRASDGRARKPFVLAGYTLATLTRPLLALAASPWHVVAIRTVDRVGKGIRAAPRDAIVAHAVAPSMRGRAFGFHRMMDNSGAVLGPIIAFALARGFGWPLRAIFAAALVPGLVAVATVVFGVRERDDTSGGDVHRPRAAPLALPRPLRAYLGVVFVFTLGASADSFLMLRLSDLGLADAWLPLAWVSLSAAKAATNIPGGRISDRFGRRRTQVAGWLLYALTYALFATTRSIATTWAILVLYGAHYGLTEGGEKAIVADLAPANMRGRAFGALHAITGAAILPANALFGLLYARHPPWAFGAGAACALVAALALARLAPLHARSPGG